MTILQFSSTPFPMGIIWGILLLIVIYQNLRRYQIAGNWNHLFRDFKQNTEEYYDLIFDNLKNTEIPDYYSEKITLREYGIFSHNRLYLKIWSGRYTFYICAAPWGNGFFFSWWLRQELDALEEFLYLIPIFGPWIVKSMQKRSFYQLDTEAMFRKSVHESVLQAIDQLTNTKGVRLTEFERKPDLRSILSK